MNKRNRRKKWISRILIGGGLVLGVALVTLMIKSVLQSAGKPTKQIVHQIAILKPPPPPPPPKEEPKPPEVKKEEVKLPEPKQEPEPAAQDDKPAGKDLGVDADGTGAGDNFGLVGKKGGQDITSLGSGGNARALYAFYTGQLQRYFYDEFAKNKNLRNADFVATVRIWLNKDGAIQRFELVGTSGNADSDDAIRLAFSQMAPVKEPPPENMPQPIKLRITSRGAG